MVYLCRYDSSSNVWLTIVVFQTPTARDVRPGRHQGHATVDGEGWLWHKMCRLMIAQGLMSEVQVVISDKVRARDKS